MTVVSKVDPLNTSPFTQAEAIEQINLLNDKAHDQRTLYPNTTIELAEQALALSTNDQLFPTAYLPGLIRSRTNLSHGFFRQNKLEQALRHALAATAAGEQSGHAHLLAFALESLGLIYGRLGESSKSAECFQAMRRIGLDIDDDTILAYSYKGLGIVSGESYDSTKSIEYSNMALDLFRKIDDRHGQAIVLNNLCSAHGAANDFDAALKNGLASLALSTTPQLQTIRKLALIGVGTTYTEKEQFEEAHHYFDLSHELFTADDDAYSLSALLQGKGRAYIAQGNLDKAETSLKSALEAGKRAANPFCIFNAHDSLTKLYKLRGDFETALHHFEQFHNVYKEHMGAENARQLQNLEIAATVTAAEQETAVFREKAQELEQRVSERTRELELLADQLTHAYQQEAELSDLKSRIIATVSHEFRTPLTVINSSVDVLMRHFDELPVSKRGTLHKRIHDSIFYLTDLLQDIDLVDTAKRETIRPNFTPTPFNTFCNQLIQDIFHDAGEPENLTFEYDEAFAGLVSADYALLKQVVFNLVTNALKYSSSLDPIEITIAHQPHLTISIRDYGIGIPATDIDNIWQLFYRGSNVEIQRGLGLGLFIVTKLVEAMYGSIAVHSILDVGSTFTVHLPPAQTA